MGAEGAAGRLAARRATLQATLTELQDGPLGQSQKDAIGELSSYDNHPGDLATSTVQRAQSLGIARALRLTLSDVDAARDRLEAGTYGACERCGRPIPQARLEALPEARCCMTCQEAVEAQRPPADQWRPPEEALLSPPFGRSFRDNTGDVGFDGEDAWQAVARYGSSDTPADVPGSHYPEITEDADEPRGTVQGVEDLPAPGADPADLASADAE